MLKCTDCGLLDLSNQGNYYCVRYKKLVLENELTKAEKCRYYFFPKSEEGENLTPQQQLIMQNAEQQSKKLRGPV